MNLLFWKAKPLSPKDRAISESVRALKTLTVRDGRISIDPSEVLSQPGYLEARRNAARTVREPHLSPFLSTSDQEWEVIDDVGMEAIGALIAQQLQRSREAGMTYAQSIELLKAIPLRGFPRD